MTAEEFQKALYGVDLWGRLMDRYGQGEVFPRLTRKHLGIECDFSYTTLVTLLDTLMTERDA